MFNPRGGIALGILLTGIFAALKLTGILTWNWLGVLAPLGIGIALHSLIFAVLTIAFAASPVSATSAAAEPVTDKPEIDNLAGARMILTMSGIPYLDDDGEYVAPYDFERIYKDR